MLDRALVEAWLAQASNELTDIVREMHLFGSILNADSRPTDVDVLIVFGEWNVRDVGSTLRREFRRAFDRPLHIQMFHQSQAAEVGKFLQKARGSRRLA